MLERIQKANDIKDLKPEELPETGTGDPKVPGREDQ